MAVTVNLKPKVDLPVWEWCRPLPVASTGLSCTCHSADNRYIYYVISNALFRYDTISDSWNQLANSPFTPTNVIQIKYSTAHGHYGRAIGNGGGANTIELAGLQGNVFVGKKIKILSGTGAGQERTITAISNPIIKDRGVVSAASTTAISDSNTGVMAKQWKINQWRDYQVRVLYGGSANNAVRPILYNNYTNLIISDVAHASVNPWWGGVLPVATNQASSTQTLYQIESNIATVNTNWTVQPDATSNFVIMSDGIWLIAGSAGAPFYLMFYYDVAADVWYNKTNCGGLYISSLATDVAIETIQDTASPLLSGTVTSATSSLVTDSSLNLTPTTYSNYDIKILSGTAIGQTRTIVSNTSATFIIPKPWDVTPAVGDTFGVYPDTEKIHIVGGGIAAMFQYDNESDFAYQGKLFDFGVARAATATVSGYEPFAISGIVRTTNGISVLNAAPEAAGSGYLVDQILTITTGGTGGTARILAVNASGGVTQVALETSGSGYSTGAGKVTSVVPTGGTGCTLNITAIAEIATVTTVANHLFKIGNTVTIAGSVQADYNGAKTIISQGVTAPTTALTFAFVVLNSPTTPATFTNVQAATQLFDLAKNWEVNEHVGKLVNITTAASPAATTVTRRITANTSNSLTFATITTAPTNSTHRYTIVSDKAFATDETIGSAEAADSYSGRGNSGVATSGTTTSLTDSSKNWPINYWSNTFPTGASNTGRRVRIIEGTGAGNEMTITSNSATTLNFATQTFTPDATSVYMIMDCFGIATAGATSSLTDTTQNWGTNIWSVKRIRITGGT